MYLRCAWAQQHAETDRAYRVLFFKDLSDPKGNGSITEGTTSQDKMNPTTEGYDKDKSFPGQLVHTHAGVVRRSHVGSSLPSSHSAAQAATSASLLSPKSDLQKSV